jgi:hypothetical protein
LAFYAPTPAVIYKFTGTDAEIKDTDPEENCAPFNSAIKVLTLETF